MIAKTRAPKGSIKTAAMPPSKPPRLPGGKPMPATSPRSLHDGKPLVHKATRIDERALNAVLAQMRLTEANKDRVRAVLVDGVSMRAVASSDAVSPELVSATVRRVRAKLHGNLPPDSLVTVSLTLPLVWAEELRGLSELLNVIENSTLLGSILKDVQKAFTMAKTKALNHEQ